MPESLRRGEDDFELLRRKKRGREGRHGAVRLQKCWEMRGEQAGPPAGSSPLSEEGLKGTRRQSLERGRCSAGIAVTVPVPRDGPWLGGVKLLAKDLPGLSN